MSIEQILAGLDSLTAEQIQERLADLAGQDKALRVILRSKLQAERERRKIAPGQSSNGALLNRARQGQQAQGGAQ